MGLKEFYLGQSPNVKKIYKAEQNLIKVFQRIQI